MLKHVRAWALALASLALAPAVHAACPTPTLTGLTGKDASSITQTLMTIIPPSQTQQAPVHINDVWNGATYAPMISDANCNTQVGAPDGAVVTLGSQSDAAWTAGNGTVIAILKGLYAAVSGPIPQGSAIIGKVGIDQTTPGTTNAVQATNFPAVISTGAGATGASSPRYTVAQDSSTAAGIAPCTQVIAINQTASTDVYTSTAKVHVCSLVLFTQAAAAVSVVEGTGSTCATGTAALIGATTATWGATNGTGNGLQFFAGQGISQTSGVPFMQSKTAADHICILQAAQSGTSVVSGFISFSDN